MVTTKYSVISTCYNCSKYLSRIISSLDNQTYNNFEFIVVNDGSSDDTGKMLDEYKATRSYMHVIHTENRGMASAIKTAIYYATGDYYLFMDSDDELLPEAIEVVDKYIEQYSCDIIVFGFRKVMGEKIIHKTAEFSPFMIEDKREQLLTLLSTTEYNPLWRKAIKASLIKGVKNEGVRIRVANDLYICIEAYEAATTVLFVPDYLYIYYINNGSIMHGIKYKNYTVGYPVGEKVLDTIKRLKVFSEEDYAAYKAICIRNVINQANGICLFDTTISNKIQLFNQIKDTSYYKTITTGKVDFSKTDFLTKIDYHLFKNNRYRIYECVKYVYSLMKTIKRKAGI